jgi:16S rRNA (guanine527-N7)-methyltransferase
VTDDDAFLALLAPQVRPRAARQKMIRYLRLLEKWNRVHNLSGVSDFARMASVHLLDSMLLLPRLPHSGAIADIGSGAGFPAAALAAARPDADIFAVESREKKAAFIRYAAAQTRLSNLRVVHCRAEQWRAQTPPICIVARGVAAIAKLIKMSAHLFVCPQKMLLLKPRPPEEEIKAARREHPRFDITAEIERVAAPPGPSRFIVALEIRWAK